jgi:hypothetical protein
LCASFMTKLIPQSRPAGELQIINFYLLEQRKFDTLIRANQVSFVLPPACKPVATCSKV